MGTDRDGFLKIRWPLASILWSILTACIWFGYNTMSTAGRMQSDIREMSANVQGLARGVSSLEKRMDLEAQSRYTVNEAAKDLALVNAQLDEHKRRMNRLEGIRK
jgi:hypothetical protein